MQRPQTQGKMAQVRLPAPEVERLLQKTGSSAVVAVLNGPRSTVVSGEAAAVEAFTAELERAGISFRPVATTWAFHAPPMAAVGRDLTGEVGGWLTPRAAERGLLSTLTGGRLQGPEMDAAYWGRQVREPVAFAKAFDAALAEGVDLVVEMSPHPLLQEGMQEAAEAAGRRVALLAPLRKGAGEAATAREALAAAWAHGVKVRWEALLPGRPDHVELPTYPWERQPCWLPPAPKERAKGHPLSGEHLALAGRPGEHVFSAEVSLEDLPLLADHQVQGSAVMPVAAYVEMAVQAGRAALGEGALEVKDLELRRPLVLERQRPIGLQIALTVKPGGAADFQIHAREGQGGAASWSPVAQGRMQLSP
jgi:acyl transferase domain-containing protein